MGFSSTGYYRFFKFDRIKKLHLAPRSQFDPARTKWRLPDGHDIAGHRVLVKKEKPKEEKQLSAVA